MKREIKHLEGYAEGENAVGHWSFRTVMARHLSARLYDMHGNTRESACTAHNVLSNMTLQTPRGA